MADGLERIHEEGWLILVCRTPHLNQVAGALAKEIAAACEEEDLDGIILTAPHGAFGRGTDIGALDNPSALEAMRGVIAAVLDCPLPVIAAVSGPAWGHWVELALACDARVAVPSATLAFQDVRLGLGPALGGMQFLLRRVPPAEAVRLALTGAPVASEEALSLGLFDKVVSPQNLRDAAKALGATLPPPSPQTRTGRPKGTATELAEALSAHSATSNRAAAFVEGPILEALGTAFMLPFEAAMTREQVAFEDTLDLPETRARLYLAQARKVASVPPKPGGAARLINEIAVLGAGGLAAEVTLSCLMAGRAVVVIDQDADALQRFQRAVDRARREEAREATQGASLRATTKIDEVKTATLVIDARTAGTGDARAMSQRIGPHLGPHAAFLSASAWAETAELADGLSDVPQVGIFHGPRPMHRAQIVEVAIGDTTRAATTATLFSLATRMGKTPLFVHARPGLALSHLEDALVFAACTLVEEGVMPADVDVVLQRWGLRRAPFMELDRMGLRRFAGPREKVPDLVALMLRTGRVGRSAGRGFYDYSQKKPSVDADLIEMVEGHRDAIGRTQKDPSPRRILRRIHLALVNAGARLLEDGAMLRAADLDVLAVLGLGVPPQSGGPLYQAEKEGLQAVLKELRILAEADSAWTPSPLIERALRNGQSFEKAFAESRARSSR